MVVVVVVVVAMGRTFRGSVLVDIKVNEEQGKDEEYADGNADRDGDAGFVGETMG